MERNNWNIGMRLSKGTRSGNQRVECPYMRASSGNINQEFRSPFSGDSYNVQNYSNNTINRNINEDSVKEYHYGKKKSVKTNYYRPRELPYDKQNGQNFSLPTNNNFFGSRSYGQGPKLSIHSTSFMLPTLQSSQEARTLKLINTVQSQKGIGGLLVFLQTDGDNAITILQNAVQSIKNGILSVISGNQPHSYELNINGEFIVQGEFINKQAAKNGLCESALNKFRKTCFFISKKKNYEEISTEDLNKPQNKSPTFNSMEGSKAHLMMLKMGWGGKGLGRNEQGTEKTVAEMMTQNVTKEGLGGKNIMNEINNILTEFARSTKLTTLAFDSGFTKEERAHIHNLAAKLNLKSKSEGKEENRRITIKKKIARWDLVKELLLENCENEAYKLTIPSDFKDLWHN